MAVAVVSADVSRLTAELWRAGDVIPATKGSAPGAGYAIHGLVSARGALAVLPLEQPVAAAAAMVRWTDATTWGDAGRRAAAWVGLRTGLAAPLVRRRVALRVTGGDGPEPALNEYMAAAVGVPQATVSVAFGSPRPNQKPIVRIHDTGGATLGYAKVAWNPLTTALVDTETAFLASAASRTLRRIRIAKVLHTGTWGGRNIAVVAPLSGSPGLRRTTPPGPAVLEELVPHRAPGKDQDAPPTGRSGGARGSRRHRRTLGGDRPALGPLAWRLGAVEHAHQWRRGGRLGLGTHRRRGPCRV